MEKTSLIQFRDPKLTELVTKTDQKTLAIWAKDCALRVLPFFEEQYPNDDRPRKALLTLQKWIDTSEFKMAVIRESSLDSHSAAREVGENNSARSAARACGQAVATAHVKTHAPGAAIYALQAISRDWNIANKDEVIKKEKEWQYQHLLSLIKLYNSRI